MQLYLSIFYLSTYSHSERASPLFRTCIWEYSEPDAFRSRGADARRRLGSLRLAIRDPNPRYDIIISTSLAVMQFFGDCSANSNSSSLILGTMKSLNRQREEPSYQKSESDHPKTRGTRRTQLVQSPSSICQVISSSSLDTKSSSQ